MATVVDVANASSTKKKLIDLRVVDLRAELEKRSLDKTGVKAALIERLTKALEEEGKNAEDYLFDETGDGTPSKKIGSKRINKKLANESGSQNNADGQEDSVIDEEEKGDSDEEKEEDADDKESTREETEGTTPKEAIIDEHAPDSTPDDKPKACKTEKNTVVVKTGSPPEAVPLTAEDTIAMDTSSATKVNDIASLIVHVDDTQSDLDGDLETSAGDLPPSKNEPPMLEINCGEKREVVAPDDEEFFEQRAEGAEGQSVEESEATVANSEPAEGGSQEDLADASDSSKSKSTAVAKDRATGKDDKERVKRSSGNSKNLWISGLSASTRATALKSLFCKYGKVLGAKIVANARIPGARCYGFVTMANNEQASKCIQHLHRTELHGKIISVERTRHEPAGAFKRTEGRFASGGGRRLSQREVRTTTRSTVETTKKVEKAKQEEPEESKKPEEVQGEEVSSDKQEKAKTVVEIEEPSSPISNAKDHDKSREKSREMSREKSRDTDRMSREPRSRSHSREYRGHRGYRSSRPFYRGRGRGRFPMRGRFMRDRGMGMGFRRPYRPMFRNKASLLTFHKIKYGMAPQFPQEERFRQKQRLRERELREVERRRSQEMFRQKEIERKQREETIRLERERERLRIEREKLQRERAEVLRLEREKQRMERERLEREREELRRREQMSRVDEPRRPPKRVFENRGGGMRESDPYWEERKRPARYESYENRERPTFVRHDNFDRRNEGGRDKTIESGRPEFDTIRRDSRRGETSLNDRDDRRIGGAEHRFDRTITRESSDMRNRDRGHPGRGIGRDRERMGPPRNTPSIRRPLPRDDWKAPSNDRSRMHGMQRDRSDRYIDSGKGLSVQSSTSYSSGGRSFGGDRDSWSGQNKSYGSGSGVMSGGPQWNSGDSRKMDSSHGPSWSSQGDRWGGGMGTSMEPRNTRQQGGGMGQSLLSQPQSSMYGSSSVASSGVMSGMGSGYNSDRYIPNMRRY